MKKGALRNFATFTGQHLCQSPFLIKFIKKETLTQVFSCEFCKISKNTFYTESLRMTASVVTYPFYFIFNSFFLTIISMFFLSFSVLFHCFLRSSQACNFIKKQTLAQVFSCEFCEISKDTFSYRTPLVTVSVSCRCS